MIWRVDWDGVVVTEADYQALEAFKHDLTDPKGVLRSWNDSTYGACSGGWVGIKCAQGQVIVIQLPWRELGGRITEKNGQFQPLRKLSLHNNVIGGSIPVSFGFLPNHRGVQLFNNRFSGSIPSSLGLCPLLLALDLGNSSLSGEIPSSFVNSTKLFRLDLSFDRLTVLLRHNQIEGGIPVITSNISSLKELDLFLNNLSGEIPVSLGYFPNLDSFNVSYNHVSGTAPPELLQKFNSSSFLGNSRLCGYSASTPALHHHPQVNHTEKTWSKRYTHLSRDSPHHSANNLLHFTLLLDTENKIH
ncbi:hypothetical protein F511_09280 [Dorcoceras hygrometricum]|uniref:Leucine-rich repeat-containing N-terminal plant-type domain-containing protein n=1 Tax=Dorcoceras hygrometricum TaxID=472368 RepID=A0A2Z7C9N7_9LAMI|nr:hypothetical protein F511_09280 [Dorcoceras hygrometricum]